MKYFFIVLGVALALITENGILADDVYMSTSCDNYGCKVVCKINGKVIPCNGSSFKDSTNASVCGEKECSKKCTKKGKKGVCKSSVGDKGKKAVKDKCVCQ
uniref:Defensin-like protein n=1 Tax=Strongyloides stercoralis TaxID=6248 RepID=A0A0K0E4L9_STRER